MTELTPEEKNELFQKIWSLRNIMVDGLEKLEKIHNKPFPTVQDGSEALYSVYDVWNSGAYSNLEKFIKKME